MRRLVLLGVNVCVAVCARERQLALGTCARTRTPETNWSYCFVIHCYCSCRHCCCCLCFASVFVSKHFRLFVTQTKTRRTVSKTKRTDKKKRQEKRKTMRRLSTGSKVRQGGWGRKNNINSSRNYELQLFSCLGHFSSSFLSRCDAQVLPTWLKAETAKHTRTHSFSLPVSFHFSSSHLAGPQKNKALQKSKKSWQTFKYLNVLSSGLSRKCYAATPTLSCLSLHDLTEIEFPVSCLLFLLLLSLLLPCAFAGTSKLKLPLCLTLFFARSTDIYSIYKNSGRER